jgi:hypothetical protein
LIKRQEPTVAMNAEPNEVHLRRRQKIQDDKDFTSARISESARYIGFGLAALTMAFLTSDAAFPKQLIARYEGYILLASAFGCLTIVLDYLHYLTGYISSEAAGQNKEGDFGYLTQSTFYKARRWFFIAKQIVALSGAMIFIIVLLTAIAR